MALLCVARRGFFVGMGIIGGVWVGSGSGVGGGMGRPRVGDRGVG